MHKILYLFLAMIGALGCSPAPSASAPEPSAGEQRFALAPSACVSAGWKTVNCVKSSTSSRWYVGTPISAVRYSESLVVFTGGSEPVCVSTGTRSCGSHAYDVCNDRGVNYFYCGQSSSHLVEGYFKR